MKKLQHKSTTTHKAGSFFSTLVATSLLLTLFLSACGTDSTASPAQNLAKPLKVVALLPLTGSNAASYGLAMRRTLEFAVSDNNKNSQSRKVELTMEDSGTSREDAVNAYKRALEKGRPDAILLATPSSQAVSLSPLVKADGIPALLNPSSNPQLTLQGNDWLFSPRTPDDSAAVVTTQFVLNDLKKKKIALLHSSDEVGFALVSIYVKELQKQGIEPLVTVGAAIDASDFKEAIAQIKTSQAEVVLAWHYRLPAEVFIRQARTAGLTIPIVGNISFGQAATIQNLTAPQMQEVYSVTDILPSESTDPAVQALIKRFKEVENGATPDAIAVIGYDSIGILAWAGSQGANDAQGLRKALGSLKNFKGLKGTYNADADGNGRLSATAVLLDLNGGKPVIKREFNK